MTKQNKILAMIAAKGWATAELYWDEAKQLEAAGKIKMDHRFTATGNRKDVWVAA